MHDLQLEKEESGISSLTALLLTGVEGNKSRSQITSETYTQDFIYIYRTGVTTVTAVYIVFNTLDSCVTCVQPWKLESILFVAKSNCTFFE